MEHSTEVEFADLHVLRDMWEVRWGYARKGLHENSLFWWAVAQRLADTGWLYKWPAVTPTMAFFQLKNKEDSPCFGSAALK